jgi:acetyltransferase
MFDMCRVLATFPQATVHGRGRVAVLSGSGGAGIVASDLIESSGLELADLSPATRESLAALYPDWMPVANPVDLFPAIDRSGFRAYLEAFRAVCADPNVDAVLFHLLVGGSFSDGFPVLADIARAAGKPVFCWLMGLRDAVTKVQKDSVQERIPVFRELSRAVECLATVLRRTPPLPAAVGSPARSLELGGRPAELLRTGDGTLDEHDAKHILGACGIPVVEERLVADADEVAQAAAALGFPVVLKGLQPGVVHKTERGLVRLGIASAVDAAAQYEELYRAMSGRGKILVQRQVRGEVELIVGLVRDAQFGPCVMLGFGGVMAEVLGEPVFAVAPLCEDEARRVIDRLKPQKLLHGFRGAAPVDREVLARVLVRVGELGLAYPRVREIDINPLIVTGGKPLAVDASVILDGVSL